MDNVQSTKYINMRQIREPMMILFNWAPKIANKDAGVDKKCRFIVLADIELKGLLLLQPL
jgi:hypothetical protein